MIYVHPAYFGSELACPICNPNCYNKHGHGLPYFCGDDNCPTNLRKFIDKNGVGGFIQWMNLRGYYIVCHGYILTAKEVKEMVDEYEKFEKEYKRR